MVNKKLKLLFFLNCTLCMFAISSANPLATTPFSEIQIKDQSHFTIEFDATMAGNLNRPFPAHLDSIFLYCGGSATQSGNAPPLDSMKKCVQLIDLDTNGIALITEKNFPNFTIKSGKLYFGYKTANWYPPLLITSPVSAKTFVSGYSDPVCCEYMSTKCVMYCRSLIYEETQCPSFGIRNDRAKILVSGQIRDSENEIPNFVKITCTSKTSSQNYTSEAGNFYFSLVDCTNKINLLFSDNNGSVVKDTTIGPFSMGTNVSLSIKLPVTSSKLPGKSEMKQSIARILSASVAKGIVFALSGTKISQGVVQIYSNDGKLIRKLPFNCHGAGTYTVNWNGKNEHNLNVPSGRYTVRILFDRESLCAGILNL